MVDKCSDLTDLSRVRARAEIKEIFFLKKNECLNERMNEWMNAFMNEQMNGRMDEWLNEWMNKLMS